MSDISQPPAPQDESGRAEVLAEVERRAQPASLRPVSVLSPSPLRPLPAKAAARLSARARAGLEPVGADHPRRETWQLETVPVAVGTGGLIAMIIGFAISHHLLELIGALVLTVCVVLVVTMSAWIMSDPLRLRHDERRALTNASLWESRQPWVGAVVAAPERGLVGLGCDLVAQISASPAWNSAYLDAHRSQLDLTNELDQLDAQAYQSATARATRPADPAGEATYAEVVDRVVSLRDYARALDLLGRQLDASAASVDAELRSGFPAHPTALEYQTTALRQLTNELASINSSIARANAQHGIAGRD